MTAPKFRYIGTTDECIVCQQCGKEDLRSTVVLSILDEDGNHEEFTYYGSVCASKALAVKGGGRAVLQSARWAQEKTIQAAQDARARLEYYGLPETGTLEGTPFNKAAVRFRMNNYSPYHTVQPTWDEWRDSLREMMAAWQQRIVEAQLIGWK